MGSHSATALMWIHALTPLHPGSGTALGVVDLPVQRERHTRWPTIPGSSLKGVLRDAYRRGGNGQASDKASVEVIFGPETDQADKHAGAVSVTDARLFAFPVRSLQGVFAWVTSPGVLYRFKSDLALAAQEKEPTQKFTSPTLPSGKAIAHSTSPLRVGNHVVLEEFDLELAPNDDVLLETLAGLAFDDPDQRDHFKQRLVVVDDDTFTHFARYSTEVTARIGLDYEHKTVRQGALFYQEFLPAECVFYSVVLAHPSRNGEKRSASDILNDLKAGCPAVLQIGGDETIGKGFCAVRID